MTVDGPCSMERKVLPVKNTFIHFDTPCEEATSRSSGARRMLKRGHSDPHGSSQVYGLRAADTSKDITDLRAPELTLLETQELAFLETQSSSSPSLDGSTEVNTPEHTPRRHLSVESSSSGGPASQSPGRGSAGVDTPETGSMGRSPPALPRDERSDSSDGSTEVSTPELTYRGWSRSQLFTDAGMDESPHPSRFPTPLMYEAPPGIFSSALQKVGTQHMAALPVVPPMPNSVGHVASETMGSGKADLAFSFTLRLADDVGLGLDVLRPPCDSFLAVQQILPKGAIEAWNRQCVEGNTVSTKSVLPGDVIVGINGASGCPGMLQECREKRLLKLSLMRPSSEKLSEAFAQEDEDELHAWSLPLGMLPVAVQGAYLPMDFLQSCGISERLPSCKKPART